MTALQIFAAVCVAWGLGAALVVATTDRDGIVHHAAHRAALTVAALLLRTGGIK